MSCNPCYNGRCAHRAAAVKYEQMVVILVIMEGARTYNVKALLYYAVVILVIMEGARTVSYERVGSGLVVILVIMEDARTV